VFFYGFDVLMLKKSILMYFQAKYYFKNYSISQSQTHTKNNNKVERQGNNSIINN